MIPASLWLALLTVTLGCGGPRAEPSSPSTPRASAADSALLEALDRRAPTWLAASAVPSLAVAYVRDGEVRWARIYGEQEEGTPASPRTLYNTASLAKPLSAEIILRLAAAGRVSLDEPISPVWVDPDVARDPRHRQLTLRLLLSHRSGFRNWRYETAGVLRFEREPGTALGYSGEGFEYAKRFVERKLGTPWDSLARQYLFEPARMLNTAHTRQSWFAGRLAHPFLASKRYGEPHVPDSANTADDVYTTIADYGAFLAEIMVRRGLPARLANQRDSIHVVNVEATADCDPAAVRCPTRIGMGLGWEILEFPGETVRLHSGGDAGEKTMVLYLAERREGAVLFTNGEAGLTVILDAFGVLFPGTGIADLARSKR